MPRGTRSKDQRTITVSVPKWLVAEIDKLSESENRSRSNWIVTELEKFVNQKKDKITVLPNAPAARAAEHGDEYRAKKGKGC